MMLRDAVRLARNQVHNARGRRPKRRAVGVVAHGKDLRIVPQCCDRIAVVITHCTSLPPDPPTPVYGGEQIHQAGIERLLLREVVMILVRSDRLRTIQAEGVGRARCIGRIRLGLKFSSA